MADVGRIFVGLAPSDEARAALAASLRGLQPLPGRRLPPENWHLTLRYIGRMEGVAYDRLLGELDQAGLGGPFRIRLDGLGAFPNPRRATVLWVGVDHGVDEVAALAEMVEGIVGTIGFEPEDRPFHPHLTLSRIRPPENVTGIVETDLSPVAWQAQHLTVFRSHLGSPGARYEPLEVFDL